MEAMDEFMGIADFRCILGTDETSICSRQPDTARRQPVQTLVHGTQLKCRMCCPVNVTFDCNFVFFSSNGTFPKLFERDMHHGALKFVAEARLQLRVCMTNAAQFF